MFSCILQRTKVAQAKFVTSTFVLSLLFSSLPIVPATVPTAHAATTAQITPTGEGNFTQWTNVGGADKADAVSSSNGDTSYAMDPSNANNKQTFSFPGAAIPTDAFVNSVTVYAELKKRTSTSTEFRILTENGTGAANQWTGPLETATTSYATYSHTMAVNPATGAAWTASDVNTWGVNFGIHRTTGVDRINLTHIYVVVDYETATERVLVLPNCVGTYDQWTNQGGSDKFDSVEFNDGDQKYVEDPSNANNKQTFCFPGASVPLGSTVNSVTAYGVLKKRDSSTVNFTFLAEDGSDYAGPSESATQSYATYSYEMTTDPTTGSAWTVSEVNSWTQNFGIHRTTAVDRINLSQFYLVVDYTEGPMCNGLPADIYVDGGVIVGGPNNGNAYTAGVTTLLGTTGDDVIIGTTGGDIIDGNGGNDTVCGEAGADTITTTSGDDWIDGGSHNNVINAGNGTNTVFGGGNNDTIITGTGNDTIDAGNGTNDIDDAGGDNTVTSGTGADDIDMLGNGVQNITSGAGADTINTGDGNDIIDAGSHDNIIDAGNGNNQVTGGNNNDTIITGTGNDTIIAGNGTNDIDDAGGDNTVTSGTGADDIDMLGNGVQNITSGAGADTINTGDGNDIIDAGTHNNIVDAGNGNNQVTTGGNNDTITTGTGNDTINAGNGTNTIIDAGGDNTVTSGSGVDDITMNGGGNNNITSGANADIINTGDGDDVIDAGTHNNTVNAGNGNNVVTTGGNNDTVTTGDGHDHINVGNGTNIVNSGAGNDSIVGGTGTDTFDGGDGVDYCDGKTGSNTITNCEYDAGDGNGVVVIEKDALPDHEQDFGYTGDLGAFTLDDDVDGTYSNIEHQPLTIASYDVTESVVSNWDLTDLTCYDVDGGSTVSIGTRTITAELDQDEVITCVFENTLTVTYDFGDAEDPDYDTLLANDGARHIIVGGVYLGSTIDDETDGQPNATATGDDTDGTDDEDGVEFGVLMAGEMGTGTVTASTAGYVDAWVDFNDDGDWDDAYEQILDDEAVVAGANSIIFPVPTAANVGDTFARFRFSTTTIASYTGEQADGEVEDYVVTITAPVIPVCDGESATIYVDGNDYIVGGPLDGTMFAGTLTGTSGDDVIVGTSGNDTITGEAGNDLICGGDGEDDIDGNSGEDEIYGEGDDDYLEGGDDADYIEGGEGEDEIYGEQGLDEIRGGDDADEIYGGPGADELYGDDGEDYIYGDQQPDTIYGGAGDDHLFGILGPDTIYGGTGNDYIEGGAGEDEIHGENGDDEIYGGPQDDSIRGGDGEDEIYGGFDNDFLCGDNDDDYIEGNGGDDTICGMAGDDELYGNDGDDDIDGGDDTDVIDGGAHTIEDKCSNGETVSNCENTTDILLCDGKAPCTPDDTTLEGYWRLDESQGNSVAKDSSGQLNHGTYNGTTQSTDVPGALPFGNMYSRDFDGVDDYVDLGNIADFTSSFTVSAWVNPDTLGADRQIVSRGYDGTNTQWELKMSDAGGKVVFQSFQGGSVGVESLSALPTGTWTHVVGTYDGHSWYIYFDGVLDNSAGAAGPIATTQSVLIGAVDNQGTPIQFWDGKIDDVRIFDRALSDTEVAELAAGECEDSGAVSVNFVASSNTGVQGSRYRKQNLIRYLLGLGNAGFGNVGVAPGGFGGPGPGNGDGELTNDQLIAMCEVRKKIDVLEFFDIVEFMAENYAHIYDVTEELILDILENGTGCDVVEAAQAMQKAREEQALAQAEAERQAEILAAIEARKPKPVEFAVDSDGYPVSSDMIWNACIRNYQVFYEGEDKPINCRRFHKGHTWEHPDTFMSFTWSDRLGGRNIGVHGKLVATYTVPAPEFIAGEFVTDTGHVVTRYEIPASGNIMDIVKKGVHMVEKLFVQEATVDMAQTAIQTIVTNVEDIVPTTTVLSEQAEALQ